jgi:hypothetical protein
MAVSATFALKAGVWFRRGRLLIVSPDSRGTACPLSGRNSTYRPVQILEAGSTILLIILVIALLGGFSGLGGGPFYGTGYYGGGILGLVLVIVLILLLLGKL